MASDNSKDLIERALSRWVPTLTILSLLICSASAVAEVGGATVGKIAGKVTVADRELKVGDSLKADDEITVGKDDAYIDLKFSEGHQVRLKDGAKLKLGALKNGMRIISLSKGKAFVRFVKGPDAKGLEVKTKAIVAGIRGTKFAAAIDDDGGTYLCVCEGAVEARGVKGGPAKTVKAGQDLWAKLGKPLGNPVDSPDMASMTEKEFASMAD